MSLKEFNALLARKPDPITAHYETLCYQEANGSLPDSKKEELEKLKTATGILTIRDDKGNVVMCIGSRESQIDLSTRQIIAKIITGEATDEDKERYKQLCDERMARMTAGIRRRITVALNHH